MGPGSLLAIHLTCAAGALVTYWIAAVTAKGGQMHRRAGRWFTRAIVLTAATGGLLALMGIVSPSTLSTGSADPGETRRWMWFLLYLLVVIVAPVQHGVAVVAAGPSPVGVRSLPHLVLNATALAGAVALLAASLIWRAFPFLVAVPAGFALALRQMLYTNRPSAIRPEWEREHLTSLISAGIALHTALFVLLARRSPDLVPPGWGWAPWIGPALVGLPVMWWLRRGRRSS